MEIFVPIDSAGFAWRCAQNRAQEKFQIIVASDSSVREGRWTRPPQDFAVAKLPGHDGDFGGLAIERKLCVGYFAPICLWLHNDAAGVARKIARDRGG